MSRILTLPNVRREFHSLEGLANSGISPSMRPGLTASPSFAIDGQEFQSFCLCITNTGGVLQVRLSGDGFGGAAPGGLANRILASNYAASDIPLPTVSSTVDFGRAPAGLYSGTLNVIVLNTAAQALDKFTQGLARITLYDGNNTNIRAYQRLKKLNVNGRSWYRPEFWINNDMTGAGVNVNTTLLPSTRRLFIQFFGFLG